MFKSRYALSAAAVIAVVALTGCGSSGNTVTSGSDASAAPAAAAETPAAAKTTGTFGDTITFPNGVAVTVSKAVVVPAAQYAAGAVEGQIVTFDLSVKNGGTEDFAAALMGFPKVTVGAQGTQVQNATDINAGIGSGTFSTILPGETQTVKLGYGIPAAEFGDVRMEVTGPTFSDKPAIFKGAIN